MWRFGLDNSVCVCANVHTHTLAIMALLSVGHHYGFTTRLCLLFLLSAPLLACVVCAMHYLWSHQCPFQGGQGSIYSMGGDFSSKPSIFPPLPPPQKKNILNCNWKSFIGLLNMPIIIVWYNRQLLCSRDGCTCMGCV